jgi:hypothetical protein
MPLPQTHRLREYATKGLHLAGRQVALSPEVRSARRLRDQAPPEGDGPVVAVLTPRDWTAHVQWEAMIAQALRLRGARVRFVTCGGGLSVCDRVNVWEGPPMPCRSCTAYVDQALTAHGFTSTDLLDRVDAADDWPELDGLSLGELVQVTDEHGLPLGRLTEIPVKWFLMRSDLHEDALAAPTWRAYLRSARRVARGLESTLDAIRPDVALLLNGLFLFEAVAWELCRRRGIDVVTYERGFIKESLVFARNAPAGLTELDQFWPDRRDRPLAADETARLDEYLHDRRHGRRTIDRYWDDADFELGVDRGEGRLVALFTNLTWDSAVIGRERAFPDIQEWLVSAIRHLGQRPQDRLVVRLHPAEEKLPGKQTREPLGAVIEGRIGTLPDNVTVVEPGDPMSSYPLMEASDLGLVYSSTTGLEMALAGTPVIVAGETHYRGKGFTIDVDSPDGFHRALDDALDAPAPPGPDVDAARRYAHLFFFEAPIASPGVEEHVPGLARLTVDDLSDLAPGANAAVDRICEGIIGGGEFAIAPGQDAGASRR